MEFFYESFNYVNVIIFILYMFAIVGLNEFARRSLFGGIVTFVVTPILLLLFVWPNTVPGSVVVNWFQISKLLAIVGFCLVIMLLRYNKKLGSTSWFKYIIPIFLAINMLEAIIREFEVSTYAPGVQEGLFYMGGYWNILNATAGIINLILISGFVGIYVTKDKNRAMIWSDQTIWWIIGYDLWNFTYMYNCIGNRAFYVLGPLLAATYAAHRIQKGAWMQHRAYTLAINELILFTTPAFFISSEYAIDSAWNPNANGLLSLISLVFNIGLLIYQIKLIKKTKKNPYKEELYVGEPGYQEYENIH